MKLDPYFHHVFNMLWLGMCTRGGSAVELQKRTHRPRLEAVPSIFKFVIQSMRYVPSLYDYILHVNVSYAWGSILISGRSNSVFSLARSLVRSPSRSPATRTAFVPRRRWDAKSRPPTSYHYNLRRAEANRTRSKPTENAEQSTCEMD